MLRTGRQLTTHEIAIEALSVVQKLEKRVEELEKVSHEQGVLDPDFEIVRKENTMPVRKSFPETGTMLFGGMAGGSM